MSCDVPVMSNKTMWKKNVKKKKNNNKPKRYIRARSKQRCHVFWDCKDVWASKRSSGYAWRLAAVLQNGNY